MSEEMKISHTPRATYKGFVLRYSEWGDNWEIEGWEIEAKSFKAICKKADQLDIEARRVDKFPVLFKKYGDARLGHLVLRDGADGWCVAKNGERVKVDLKNISMLTPEVQKIVDAFNEAKAAHDATVRAAGDILKPFEDALNKAAFIGVTKEQLESHMVALADEEAAK